MNAKNNLFIKTKIKDSFYYYFLFSKNFFNIWEIYVFYNI